MMLLAIGSDHAGYELKEDIKLHLKAMGHEVTDFGAMGRESVDYPDIGLGVARKVADGSFEGGILVCGTGIGMSIAANKVKGIRAALCGDTFSARAAREHNDANILVLGERVVGKGLARDIVSSWLGATFLAGRHGERLAKIAAAEER